MLLLLSCSYRSKVLAKWRIVAFLLFLSFALPSAFAAEGRFDVYCDGVGISLEKIQGLPASRKLVLFSYLGFPAGTMGGAYLGEGRWSDVEVYSDGCVPDGKCGVIAHGRVWIEDSNAPQTKHGAPRKISGRYVIELNGKSVAGTFIAKYRRGRRIVRICM